MTGRCVHELVPNIVPKWLFKHVFSRKELEPAEGRRKACDRVDFRRLCFEERRVSLCHALASHKVEAAECANASFPHSVTPSMYAEGFST